jgi:hypothetical protein
MLPGVVNNKHSYKVCGAMASKNRDEEKVLLTLPNIKYLVEGLDSLLMNDLDGEKRVKVIQLRNELLSHINSIFTDYS